MKLDVAALVAAGQKLATEKGELGLAALGDVARRFDPDGLLNPGVLLPAGSDVNGGDGGGDGDAAR